MPTREDAWELLNEYTKNQNLVRHMLAVEAAMRAYARRFGEDEETWGVVSLIHDFDYEESERLRLRSLQLNPSSATTHQWYAEFLSAMLSEAEGWPLRVESPGWPTFAGSPT